MKKILALAVLTLLFVNCQESNNQKSKKDELVASTNQEVKNEKTVLASDSEGYKLMQQNCFTCHFEKPDPSKKSQMIAPPMLNIQEHYKPSFGDKKAFVEAIVKWVNKPSKAEAMMPGAVRKFNLMPPMPIGDEKITKIAEVLYDIDFGDLPVQRDAMKSGVLSLNNGKKWQLQKQDYDSVLQIAAQLKNFKSEDVNAYHNLGKSIFNQAKKLLFNKSYDSKTLKEIQIFFHKVEDDMHLLMAVKTTKEGDNQIAKLNKYFKEFPNYFE